MDIGYTEIIVALLVAAPGIIGLLLQWKDYIEKAKKTKAETKKTDTDAADTLTDTALSLITPLKEENKRIKLRLEECERGVSECKQAKKEFMRQFEILWKGAKALQNQLELLNELPVFKVPPFPENGVITEPIKTISKRRKL